MLRGITRSLLQQQAAPMNTQQSVIEINSALSLLRMCYRSIDIKVKSRHARNFLKKRLVTQWRAHRNEQDFEKQRFLMDHAGSFLQALHMPKNPDPNQPVVFQLSRIQALRDKEKMEKDAELAKTEKKPRA